MTLKTCTGHCGLELPATAEYFHRNKGMKDGFQPFCKLCMKDCKTGSYGASAETLAAKEKERSSRDALAVQFEPGLLVDVKTGEITGRPGWLERLTPQKG